MPPIVLLSIALLQLLAPAGSMRAVSPRPSPPVPLAVSVAPAAASGTEPGLMVMGRPGDRCGHHRWNDRDPGAAGADDGDRRDDGTAYGVRRLPAAPMARSGGGLRAGLLMRSPGAASSRALDAVLAPESRAPMVGTVATTADRTSRAVAARGRLLGHLPIPPPPV
ncbi:MAG: hypothetical protein ACYC2G_16165 [Gemmatimonadaceae bacterium]